MIGPYNNRKNSSKERLRTLLTSVWFQEILLATVEIILKASLVIFNSFYKEKINPYTLAATLIIVHALY